MKIKPDNHVDEWKEVLADPLLRERSETWLRNDRLDSWRHARMRAHLDPLIEASRESSWLTIGDGRYGTDAIHLLDRGVENVHTSDISDELLKIAAERGLIKNWSVENAESLSFADDSFDYVYCKEAYHHFPRPYLAVYEMLRVARKGVVLTEPNDPMVGSHTLMPLLKRLLKRPTHGFEPVGNYVYAISAREIEKLMLGMGLRVCAFRGLNDHYIDGVENVPLSGGTWAEKRMTLKLKAHITLRDLLCRIGVLEPGLMTAILFKEKPDAALLQNLRHAGFSVRILPLNPYETA